MTQSLDHHQIASVFNAAFARTEHCVLLGGGYEPRYFPNPQPHRSVIRYRADFAASALHEAAHWCIAGAPRRRLADFGYWYAPPPRTQPEQDAFMAVEAKAQAVEAYLAERAGVRFKPSLDDITAVNGPLEQRFTEAIGEQLQCWLRKGLPSRAARFAQALERYRRSA